MAREVVTEFIDDRDGMSRAEHTIGFSIDGVSYEIDLCSRNAEALRGVFAVWTPHARRLAPVPRL